MIDLRKEIVFRVRLFMYVVLYLSFETLEFLYQSSNLARRRIGEMPAILNPSVPGHVHLDKFFSVNIA